MVEHNKKIHWVPETVGQRRFGIGWRTPVIGTFLETGSGVRQFRSELPDCEHEICVGSIEELASRTSAVIDDLHPHRIDHLEIDCDSCGGVMKRIPDVFDCWFESGAMPYAQNHYPFENPEIFLENFPAQFIAEGVDQTRGWFYTLLVLSTALFDASPFKNCIVNGMVLAEDGSKMSKSKQNYPAPELVLEKYGADALRAYLVTSPVVRAEPMRFTESGVKDVVRTVLLPLQNAWSYLCAVRKH